MFMRWMMMTNTRKYTKGDILLLLFKYTSFIYHEISSKIWFYIKFLLFRLKAPASSPLLCIPYMMDYNNISWLLLSFLESLNMITYVNVGRHSSSKHDDARYIITYNIKMSLFVIIYGRENPFLSSLLLSNFQG